MHQEVTPRSPALRALRAIIAILPALLALGCGGNTEPAESPADRASSSEASSGSGGTSEPASPAKAATPEIVTTCEEKGKLCLPPADYVKKLCENGHADLALVYFKKGTAFTRAYLKGTTEAWNASGGASSQDKLVFDEEVIVLLERGNTSGIQVSGAGTSYDVMRWDGSCASLSAEEITFSVAPKPKTPVLKWKSFSDESQNAMLNDANIAKLNKERRNECKGVDVGTVSLACVKLVDKLSEAIVTYIRNGGEVPVPKSLK